MEHTKYPTQFLPPLGQLLSYSTDTMESTFASLRHIYLPSPTSRLINTSKLVFPTRKFQHVIHDMSVPDSGYASAEEDEDIPCDTTHSPDIGDSHDEDLEIIRSSTLERTFTIQWITKFISHSDGWIYSSEDDANRRTDLLDAATSLLSSFSSNEEEEDFSLTRTFDFTLEGGDEIIQIELNDAPLSNEDHTSVGLQSWGSSILLAERFCSDPRSFELKPYKSYVHQPFRVLELGAGTGMLSIITAKLLQRQSADIHNDSGSSLVVATDYHPDVLENLERNVVTNFPLPAGRSNRQAVSIHLLDWEHPTFDQAPFNEPFDLILAADVIYHPLHAQWIKGCVERLLRPSTGIFWLIIPVRSTGRHEGLDLTVDALFPLKIDSKEETGRRLVRLSETAVDKQTSVGRADEGAYRLFKIGWVG